MPPVQWGTVDIVEFPPYTDEEAQAVWYEPEELEKIISNVWETVNKLNHEPEGRQDSHNLEDDENCIRGLEEMTVKGSLGRLVAKYSMDLAVLEEQKSQTEKGVKDEEALARASRAESQRHVNKAVEYGKQDQEMADKYLNRGQEPLTTKPMLPEKRQPWFRRRGTWKGKPEYKRRPRASVGLSLRRILGMKR